MFRNGDGVAVARANDDSLVLRNARKNDDGISGRQ